MMIAPNKLEQEKTDRIRQAIPEPMRAAKRWLVWALEKVPDREEPGKVPYYSTTLAKRSGRLDAEQGAARLDTLDGALSRLATGKWSGIGFALGPDGSGQCWQGVDLDDVAEHPDVAAVVDKLPGWVEESPSGLGYHAIGKGREFRTLGSNKSGVEAYAGGRFFTVTGNARGGDIEDLADFVEQTLAPLHRGKKTNGSAPPEDPPEVELTEQQQADLRAALFTLDADEYAAWIRFGLALKGLGEFGRLLWLEWSSTSDKYTVEQAEAKWAGFDPRSTSYRAIFAEAQRRGWKNPQRGAWRQESADLDGDEDYTTPPPRPDDRMFYGLVGDVAHAGADGKEVSPVSVGLACISWLSAHIGRDMFIRIGDLRHPIVINTLHVGRSMIAGKGESSALIRRVERSIRSEFATAELLGRTHTGGLSTAEGLALQVHDGFTMGKQEVPPIDDKRLLAVEGEFGGLLEKMKREGNALSATIRDLFDGGSIRPAIKNSPVWATNPHVVIHANITAYELHAKLDANSIHNGLANRFLMVWAERVRLIPIPSPTDPVMVEALAKSVVAVVRFALGDYPEATYQREVTLSPAAQELYAAEYARLRSRDPMGELITVLLERRAPITLRLAALFAITDLTTVIEEHHLSAAIAWTSYHRDSVRFVFGADAEQRQKAMVTADHRQKVVAFLRSTGDWVMRRDITRGAFKGHIKADALTDVLQAMLADGQIERDERSKANDSGVVTFYRATPANHANYANN